MLVTEQIAADQSQTDDAQFGPDAAARLPALTLGGAVAGAVVLAGALMRLYGLGSRPLQVDEAARALVAFRYVQGDPVELTGFSPLLTNLNLLVFSLAGSSDFWARIVPAICGSILVALPVMRFRHRLGTGGALIASMLLALSPTFLLLSRSVDPAMLSAVTSLVFVGAVFDFVDHRRRQDPLIAAGALALALTAGPGIYTVLLFVVVFAVGAWLLRRSSDVAGWDRLVIAFQELQDHRDARVRTGAVFGTTFLVAATGFLINFAGVQASLTLFVDWLRSFSLTSEYPFWYYGSVLLLYEPVILTFGLLGGVLAVRHGDHFATFLLTWFLGSFVLYTLVGTTEPALLVPILLPLAILASQGVMALLGFSGMQQVVRGLLVTAFIVPILVYAIVQLAFYAETTTQPTNLLLALGAAAVAVLVAVIFASSGIGMGWRAETVGRGVGISVLLLSMGLTLHMNGYLNFRGGQPIRELLLTEPTSLDMREVVDEIETLSQERVGDTVSLPVTVDGRLAPVVPWYLKGLTNLDASGEVRQPPGTPVVLIPATDEMPPIGDQYVGQGFRLSSHWRLVGLKGRDLVRWYFYRDGGHVPNRELVLFVAQR